MKHLDAYLKTKIIILASVVGVGFIAVGNLFLPPIAGNSSVTALLFAMLPTAIVIASIKTIEGIRRLT